MSDAEGPPQRGLPGEGAAAPADPLGIFAAGLFQDQTVLVTGGGRGIGREIALAFARFGANLVIAGRKPERLEATAADIRALGRDCLAVPMSIREVDAVDGLVARSLDTFGSIDCLVNNAGGQFPARPSAISDRGWRAVVDLNLHGTWNMCSRVGAHMVARRSGRIVNIVHIYSFDRGAPWFAHSGAARAGVVSMTRTLSYWWARHGVNVNALAPGTVATAGLREEEFAPAEIADVERLATQDVPAQRLGSAAEMAAITLFLCSPAARYVNGTTLVADGGLSHGNWTTLLDPEVP